MDKYPNIINQQITMSAANTLTFQEIDVGFGQFERVGLLVSRWEIMPTNASVNELVAATDYFSVALTADNQLSSLDLDERAVIDLVKVKANVSGTPASAWIDGYPITRKFEELPGSGLLIAPRPLYVGMTSGGAAAASSVDVRLYFTIVKLKDADFFELLEARRFYG